MVKNRMKKNSPIGFFDSGVGGLSVFSRFRKKLPSENTIYYGDLINLPYGNKTKEELIRFARNILDFFKERGVKAVVIACNTSSALAYDAVKEEYEFPIYPIIQSCASVISNMNFNKIGVFATEGTVKSGAYKRELIKHNPELEVAEIACPNWVSIVEGVNNITNPDSDIQVHINEMLKFNPDRIILGCTHYPYLLERLNNFAPKELFIDPAEIFVDYIAQNLGDVLNDSTQSGKEEFYVSADPESFLKHSKLFYDIKTLPQLLVQQCI